jgi:hypothetical protein
VGATSSSGPAIRERSSIVLILSIGVVAGVAALVSALNDGTELTTKVKTKWRLVQDARQKRKVEQEAPKMAALESALITGRTRISGTYNDYYKAMGEPFAIGDSIAVDQLKDYKILVLEQIILSMTGNELTVNYPTFNHTAVTTQQKAIDCLSNLRQRLLVAAPLQQALPWQRQSTDNSRFPVGFVTEIGDIEQDVSSVRNQDRPRSISEDDEQRDSFTSAEVVLSFDHHELLVNPWQGENVPPPPRQARAPAPPQVATQVATSPRSIPSDRRRSTGTGRPSTGSFDSYRNSPLTPQDSNEDIPSPFAMSTRTATSSTASSPPAQASSPSHRPSITSRILSRTRTSFSSSPRASLSQDRLPSESNNFLGICKGAWRLQIGADESALMMGRTLVSGSLSQTMRHWVCRSSNCRFEGSIVRNDLDRRMIAFSEQLIFKWTFLFKCHLPAKEGNDKAYGCVFCASTSGPIIVALPVYRGDRAFLTHIQNAHIGDGKWPSGETRYRVGCKVDDARPQDDNWDILLIRTGPAELDASPPSPRLDASPPALDVNFEGFGTFDVSGSDNRTPRSRGNAQS